MKTGRMLNTDFRYEEFEGLLASYYLSLKPLEMSADPLDKKAFEEAVQTLNGFAERYEVQKPEEAATHPRQTPHPWGQPKTFDSCFTIIDMLGSFWRDFGVGANPQDLDGKELHKLARTLLALMDRRGIIKAEFETIDGKQIAVGIENWTLKKYRPLA